MRAREERPEGITVPPYTTDRRLSVVLDELLSHCKPASDIRSCAPTPQLPPQFAHPLTSLLASHAFSQTLETRIPKSKTRETRVLTAQSRPVLEDRLGRSFLRSFSSKAQLESHRRDDQKYTFCVEICMESKISGGVVITLRFGGWEAVRTNATGWCRQVLSVQIR